MRGLLWFLFLLAVPAVWAGSPAKLQVARGTVHVLRVNSTLWLPIETGIDVFEGDKIRGQADTRAMLFLPDGSTADIGPWSLIHVDSFLSQQRSFRLEMGTIRSVIAHFLGGFQIVTPTAVCAVRGTDFSVSVDPDLKGKTTVEVHGGQVHVRDNQGKTTLLAAGDSVVVLAQGMQEPLRAPKPPPNKPLHEGFSKKTFYFLGILGAAVAAILLL